MNAEQGKLVRELSDQLSAFTYSWREYWSTGAGMEAGQAEDSAMRLLTGWECMWWRCIAIYTGPPIPCGCIRTYCLDLFLLLQRKAQTRDSGGEAG
ncbi:MAG: hypothetical protein K0Q90_3303 [Paenibacillaceae bacterium]|jgi:hypothetical protein|nr:hypothetical protein [Paenibacillaceae bacterium]